jgi:hypothetical protein
VAPISEVEPATVTCGICGFVTNEAGECPRCKPEIAEKAKELVDTGEDRDVVDQVADWLDAEDGPSAEPNSG